MVRAEAAQLCTQEPLGRRHRKKDRMQALSSLTREQRSLLNFNSFLYVSFPLLRNHTKPLFSLLRCSNSNLTFLTV